MACRHTRRSFVQAAAGAGAAAALSAEELALAGEAKATDAKAGQAGADLKPNSRGTMPAGKLGDLKISRLIMGGNLLAGFAHARDLMYVSPLLKAYHTEEKIFETLRLGEAHGINAINTNPKATEAINKYRRQFHSNLSWIVQGYPNEKDDLVGIRHSIDHGADAIYLQGNIADRMVAAGKLKVLTRAIEFIQSKGLPAGVGGHSLAVPKTFEKERIHVDFYVKTLHSKDYWSRQRPDQTQTVVDNRRDNYWCTDPEDTIAFMQTVPKPWIAYKVMAAGAIHPRKAFRYVLKGGADFVLAGMFDFQVAQDAQIARAALAKLKGRKRPWRA